MKAAVNWLKGINVNVVAILIGIAALVFAYTSLNNTIRTEISAVHSDLRVEISGVGSDVNGLRGEVSGLRGEVANLRVEMADLRVEVADLRTDMAAMEGRLTNSFEKRFDAIEQEQIRLQGAFDALER